MDNEIQKIACKKVHDLRSNKEKTIVQNFDKILELHGDSFLDEFCTYLYIKLGSIFITKIYMIRTSSQLPYKMNGNLLTLNGILISSVDFRIMLTTFLYEKSLT